MFARWLRQDRVERLHLASLTQLHSLSFDELGRLAPHAGELAIAAGRRLLLGGSLNHELAIIGRGRGIVRCAGEKVDELGPGDVFGRLSTRRVAYPVATVLAATDLDLVVFDARAVRHLREAEPAALDALLTACSLDAQERSHALAGPRPAPELTLVSAEAA